jgi:hypothetical protein
MIHLFWALFFVTFCFAIKGSEVDTPKEFFIDVSLLMIVRAMFLWLTAWQLHLYLGGLLKWIV